MNDVKPLCNIHAARILSKAGLPWRIMLYCDNPAKNQYKFYEIEGQHPSTPVKIRHGRIGHAGRDVPSQSDRCLDWALSQIVEKIDKRGYTYSGQLMQRDAALVWVKNRTNDNRPLIRLTGPYALIRKLRRTPNNTQWEALDDSGELLLHLPAESAKEIMIQFSDWSGSFDLEGREVISLQGGAT